jgi:hypothetical protein
LKFSAADKMKIASIIATTAGIASEGSIEDIVNRSALKFKTGRHTEEGWKLIGKMMNKATQAGIKWDKNIFNRAIWRPMGLE